MLRAAFLLILTALLALFTVLNWQAFTTPTTLSLLLGRVQAPLGLVMLAVTGLLAVLFLIYLTYMHTMVMLDSRRHAREIQAQRQLAEKSELSRLNDLHGAVEAGFRHLEEHIAQTQSAVHTRLDQLAAELRTTVEQTGTVLSAYIGEAEDRLENRILSGRTAPAA